MADRKITVLVTETTVFTFEADADQLRSLALPETVDTLLELDESDLGLTLLENTFVHEVCVTERDCDIVRTP